MLLHPILINTTIVQSIKDISFKIRYLCKCSSSLGNSRSVKNKTENMFGLFRNKDKEPEKEPLPWKNLTTEAQLDTLVQESYQRPVFIFKHSTRCGISSMTLRRFESELEARDNYGMYYLDLLTYRSLSDLVAERFQVWHQSPQLIMLRNGQLAHHSSHNSISARVLQSL